MDMNSVNFLVVLVALFGTILNVAVGQLSAPLRPAPGPAAPAESCSALNMEALTQHTGDSAATIFLSEEAVMRQEPPLPQPPLEGVFSPQPLDRRPTSIPDYCRKNCQWQLLNFALLGADGILYTPATGLGFGQTLLYQSIYSCKCSAPGSQCGGQCLSSPQYDPWGYCNYFQHTWFPSHCSCPLPTCQHSYSWHLTLVWQINSCNQPVWRRVQIPTGCCCQVTAYSRPTGNNGK